MFLSFLSALDASLDAADDDALDAAPAAEPVAAPHEDCELRTVPSGYGCVSTTVVSFPFEQRTFLHMLDKRLFRYFPCACCDNDSEENYACQNCHAPVCRKCAYFIERHNLSKIKRCRWCSELVSPLDDENPVDNQHQIALRSAQQQFSCLGDWFQRIIRIDRKFDFSGIIWQKYFAAQGWRFFINADRFFRVELPNQCDVMMANMVLYRPFFHSMHFKYFQNRKKFARVLERCSSSNQEPSLFVQSRQMALMHTMSVMMLEKREKNMRTQFFDLVLRRVHAKLSLQLSNGLGVRIPQRQEPEEDDSWMWK